jgi:hypothetical protein
MTDPQDRALSDEELLQLFHDQRADLSLLHPEEQQRLVKLTEAPPAQTAPKWYEPGGDTILDNIRSLATLPGKAWQFVSQHPVESAAMAGGIAAVPLTGAASLPAAAAAAGLGGAGGAGLGLIAKAARGDADTPQTPGDVLAEMGTQGALQAAAEGSGRVLAKGAELAGRGLYKAALRPAARLTEKYGDLVGAGLNEAAPVGSSKVVSGRLGLSKDAATDLAQRATVSGRLVPASTVTDRYLPLVDVAAKREALGVPGDLSEVAAREQAFNAAHPSGQIAPDRVLELKREADALASTAQNQLRRGTAPTDITAQLHDATRAGLNQGLSDATQGMTTSQGLSYADQNARTSQLYGLSRALRAAENRPHALTNLFSLGAGILGGAGGTYATGDYGKGGASGAGEALLFRALASPAVQSRTGIGLYELAGVPFAQAVRAALLARLANAPGEQTPAMPGR